MNLSDKLEECANSLIEHCDAVIILASVDHQEGADLYHKIAGPWHMAIGMIEHFKWSNISTKVSDKIKEDQEE